MPSLGRILAVRNDRQQGILGIADECSNPFEILEQKVRDCSGPSIPRQQPHNLRRMPTEESELPEVVILGHQDEPMSSCVLPDLLVRAPPRRPRVSTWVVSGNAAITRGTSL